MLKVFAFIFASLVLSQSMAADKDYYLFDKKYPNKEAVTAFAAPKLQKPENFSSVQGTAVQLQWSDIEDADLYHLIVATDPHFQFRVFDEHIKASQQTVEGLEPARHYYWKVAGIGLEKDAGYTIGAFNKATFNVQQ